MEFCQRRRYPEATMGRFRLCTLALLSLAHALPARAAEPGRDAVPLTVLGVKSDDALDQAEALTDALRTAVLHLPGWSLAATKDALEVHMLRLTPPCKEATACEAAIAAALRVDRIIWATITLGDAHTVVGTVNLYAGGKRATAELRFASELTDATDEHLILVARQALDKVTGGPPLGSIKIATGGVTGELSIDGTPMAVLSAAGGTVEAPAGDHAIRIKAAGYVDATAQVHVTPFTTVDATVALVPEGQAKPTAFPVDGRMIGGFVGLGVGVALGAVGLWTALDGNAVTYDGSYESYRGQFSGGTDVCSYAKDPLGAGNVHKRTLLGAASDAEAADFCARVDRGEVIQAVVFPLAGIAAGVGGILLATSRLGKGNKDAQKASAWSVQPLVGPSQQSLTVRYRF